MRRKIGMFITIVAIAFMLPVQAGAAEKSPLSFDAGIDFTTAYFFRGILQQDEGFIAQPYANAYYQINDSLKIWTGVWNSFHGQVAAGVDSPEHWYEFDFLAGIELTTGPLTSAVTYILYNSPSDAFSDIHEIEVKFSLDDSEFAKSGPLPALNPSFAVAFEIDDEARGGTEDVYAQIGIEPGFEGKIGSVPVSFSFPLTIGLSFDDYYTDKRGKNETFGYLSIGVGASTPLPLPGDWTLSASVTYLYLDAFSLRAANRNNNDPNEVIGTVGISVAF